MQKLISQENIELLFKKYKIEIPKQILAKNIKDIMAFSMKIGFPLYLKVDSQDISHKTDLGLVAKANDFQEAVKQFTRISELANHFSKNVNGILVQEFIEGPEFIIGVKNDLTFGKVIMFGTGGIYTEVFKDVSFRKCPIDEKEALNMIKETHGFQIMHSRGKNIDESKIANVLSNVSRMAVEENIEGLDINPFIAGKKYAAVDIKLVK